MISIIIPVYNQADKLRKTLISIVNQTYTDWEVIIVNDGSKDAPENIFAEFSKTIKVANKFLFLNQENKGAPSARNRGLKEARGEYVLFCDADAELKIEALEVLSAALENNRQYSYAYSSFLWGNKLFKLGPFDAEKLKQGPYIHTMSLVRRSDLPASAWDEKIKKFQDWDLWLTMLESNKIGIWVDRVLFKISPGGTISSWLPSFAYRFFPFLKAVKKYNEAMVIIKQKHELL